MKLLEKIFKKKETSDHSDKRDLHLDVGSSHPGEEAKKKESKEKPKDLWNYNAKYQYHVTISSIDSTAKSDGKVVYMEDLEKRKEAYGICEECNQPGTGLKWCQSCNAKRFEENFKNWTSGNKNIDEFIQHSQLNAVHFSKCLEWIPFENFQNVTYITRGGFGKIYSADWPEGFIDFWDIKNQKWIRKSDQKVALKSLVNSSNISVNFLDEIKSHLQIYLRRVTQCFGITQDPDSKDYMMVLEYCENGNLRDYLNQSENYIHYKSKIRDLSQIARGLLGIHNADKVHKDFHSGNILYLRDDSPLVGDLGMCQPANNEEQSAKKEGIYGVLPYMAPEILCGSQYTKVADIYSFGIVMNELLSEEIPYSDIPHDYNLTVNICQGLRPKISEDTPKLLAGLIMKCWDAKAENRPTAKELSQILNKWNSECGYGGKLDPDYNSEIYAQLEECEKIRKNKLKVRSDKDKPKNIQTHPQAIYTSRLFNFKNLPEPENSSDLSSFYTDSLSSLSIHFQNMLSELDSDKTIQDEQIDK
jgi:serine/threonine protein kinase